MNSESWVSFLAAASQRTKTVSPPLMHDRLPHRAAVSRRRFIGGTATVLGTVLGTSVLRPGAALAKSFNATPNPIPGGTEVGGQLFHFLFPGPGQEPATITDFNGFVGAA